MGAAKEWHAQPGDAASGAAVLRWVFARYALPIAWIYDIFCMIWWDFFWGRNDKEIKVITDSALTGVCHQGTWERRQTLDRMPLIHRKFGLSSNGPTLGECPAPLWGSWRLVHTFWPKHLSRSKLQVQQDHKDPVSLKLEKLEETFRTVTSNGPAIDNTWWQLQGRCSKFETVWLRAQTVLFSSCVVSYIALV